MASLGTPSLLRSLQLASAGPYRVEVVAAGPPMLVGGRYQIVRQLGQPSGQAEVYEALDLTEGDHVALKLLRSIPPGGVWQEAQILRRLYDHHILPIRNADLDRGRPFVVTELAAFGSLDGELAASGTKGLPVADVIRLIRQACTGVARAHDHGLLHNDIKPGNLFLNRKGECVVGDFGLASAIPAGAASTSAPGCTPEAVAPEIAANPTGPTATRSSDVYSLGATAYWLLAAGPPLDLSPYPDMLAKLAAVASSQPARLWDRAPHVPRTVQAAIEGAMDPDPTRRTRTVMAFAEALGRRQVASRAWVRVDVHAHHEACWEGSASRAAGNVLVCLKPGTRPTSVSIEATHVPSGRRVRRLDWIAPRRNWPQAVRSVMSALA